MNTEACLKAPNAGVSPESAGFFVYLTLFVGMLLMLSIYALKKRYNIRLVPMMGMIMLVFTFTSQIVSVPAYAASACLNAQPDSSVGAPGELQVYNVLQNDTPTPGSSFILSSLRLALVKNPVSGSIVSQGERQVNTPNEGVYIANSEAQNGTISFSPTMSFRGGAVGVKYQIKDTAGNYTGSVYKPRVTENATSNVCDENGASLPDRHASGRYFGIEPQNGDFASSTMIESTYDQSWGGVSVSSNSQRIAVHNYKSVITSQDVGSSWESQGQHLDGIADMTVSSSGMQIAVATLNGFIYTSADGGATWIERASSGSRDWQQITSSSDGMSLAATVYGGFIYTSTDGGATWTERTSAGSRDWYGITMSDDGQNIAATPLFESIYTSTDGGATWTERASAGSRIWGEIDSSSDGQGLVTHAYNSGSGMNYIYTSTDGGATWIERTSAGSRSWNNITISSNGQNIATAVYDGFIYTSTDGGATWTERTGAGSGEWAGVDSSDDGMTIVVVQNYRFIHVSTDGGATWTERTLDSPFNPYDIDLQPGSSGVQTTLDKTSSEGWTASYDPSDDELYIEVTDSDKLIEALGSGSSTYSTEFAYTVAGMGGCGMVTVDFLLDNGAT
jgi:hypothetical protein